MERTAPLLELRAAGRTVTGPVVRYGETAQDRAERFEPGAFESMADPMEMDVQHDPAIIAASTATGTLTLNDTSRALEVRATLANAALGEPGSAALELVRRGALRGLSAAFHPLAEHRAADGTRVITRAHLVRVGLVDEGSYRGSRLELRARMGRTLTSAIPANKRLACDCVGGSGSLARFAELQASVGRKIDAAVKQAIMEAAEETNDIIAAFGRYDRPLASAKTGTLRTEMDGDDLRVSIDLPDDENGRAVVAAQESAGVVIRPFLDDEFLTTTELPDGTIRYSAGTGGEGSPIRAFIVSSTDRRDGWPAPTMGATPDLETRSSGLVVARRRRLLACL